jgi:5'-methylthioadenosine phosphorylase
VTTAPSSLADLAVIGGSGFYDFLEDAEQVAFETPFGAPSEPLTIGTVAGRRVAFLPRHGRRHQFPAHTINYRANLWALRAAGVRQVVAPCAVGGLQPDLGPGALVVPDQLVDRTSGRVQTFYDTGGVHVSFADPYCPRGRAVAFAAASAAGWPVSPDGTMVVIEGPRFSTRAESRAYSQAGWSVINMTGHPEAVLAREMALCYTAVALVTDLDAGVEAASAVKAVDVFAFFGQNVDRLRALMTDVLAALPADQDCTCAEALDGLQLPFDLP